jgi:DNA-binding HxlR family transcriptional regulator
VLETFGDRWTLLIVRDLMFKGKRHFGDFLRSAEGISTNILADRLKRLEEHGIVSRSSDPESKAKLVYQLTERGKDLLPIMLEITAWSAKHDPLTNTPSDFKAALANSKEAVIKQMHEALLASQ